MAQRRVYLSLDDETVEAIGAAHDIAEQDAVADFTRAVTSRTYGGSDPFYLWNLEAKDPTLGGDPPWIALLGATVLAATRMTALKGSPAYYKELTSIIGADPDWSHQTYRDFIPRLWVRLQKWLQDDLQGERGMPSATTTANYNQHIGWAISQALLQGTDRERLNWFFQDTGLQSGTVGNSEEVLARFIEYSRAHGGLPPRLARHIDDTDLRARIASIIASELEDWDGTVRVGNGTGERIAAIELTMNGRTGAVAALLRLPEGYNQDIIIDGIRIDRDPETEFVELDINIDADMLNDGFRLQLNANLRGQLRPMLVIPFLMDEDLGRYVAVRRARAAHHHNILVREDFVEKVRLLLNEMGTTPNVFKRADLPPGWVVFRGATLKPIHREIEPALRSLQPAPMELPSFIGGLSLPGNRYLLGGAPNLVVPGISAFKLAVIIDGQPIETVDAAGAVIELQNLNLSSGHHVVEIGATTLKFELVASWVEPRPYRPYVGHRLSYQNEAFCSNGPVEALNWDAPNWDVAICGASIDIRADAISGDIRRPPQPIMVKDHAVSYLALGRPGQYQTLKVAAHQWTKAVQLEMNAFEIEDYEAEYNFDFLFVVRQFRTSNHIVAIRDLDIRHATSDPNQLKQWAQHVMSLVDRPPIIDPYPTDAGQRWLQYVEAARLVHQDA